jgi:thiamine monophosphate kinase
VDALRLADASGVAIVLDEEALVAHAGEEERRASECVGLPLLDLVLGGGEDYALLATSDAAIDGFTRIGEVRSGSGLWLRSVRGERALSGEGFDHFAR